MFLLCLFVLRFQKARSYLCATCEPGGFWNGGRLVLCANAPVTCWFGGGHAIAVARSKHAIRPGQALCGTPDGEEELHCFSGALFSGGPTSRWGYGSLSNANQAGDRGALTNGSGGALQSGDGIIVDN